MRADLGGKRAELAELGASASAKNQKHIEAVQKNVKNLESALAKFEMQLTNFDSKLSKRKEPQ